MDYGKAIKEARLAKGWSQQRLADVSGSTQSTVNRIEAGQTKWSRSLSHIAASLELFFPDMEYDPEFYPRRASRQVESSHDGDRIPLHSIVGDVMPLVVTTWAERPPQLRLVSDAYAIIVATVDMSPEFEPGDIAYFNPRLTPYPGSTCLLRRQQQGYDIVKLCRLILISETNWTVKVWSGRPPGSADIEDLLREDWPLCHRNVGRIPRL